MSATNIQWFTYVIWGGGAVFAFFLLVFVFEQTVHALRFRDQFSGGGGGIRMPGFGGRRESSFGSSGMRQASAAPRRRDPKQDRALAKEAARLAAGGLPNETEADEALPSDAPTATDIVSENTVAAEEVSEASDISVENLSDEAVLAPELVVEPSLPKESANEQSPSEDADLTPNSDEAAPLELAPEQIADTDQIDQAPVAEAASEDQPTAHTKIVGDTATVDDTAVESKTEELEPLMLTEVVDDAPSGAQVKSEPLIAIRGVLPKRAVQSKPTMQVTAVPTPQKTEQVAVPTVSPPAQPTTISTVGRPVLLKTFDVTITPNPVPVPKSAVVPASKKPDTVPAASPVTEIAKPELQVAEKQVTEKVIDPPVAPVVALSRAQEKPSEPTAVATAAPIAAAVVEENAAPAKSPVTEKQVDLASADKQRLSRVVQPSQPEEEVMADTTRQLKSLRDAEELGGNWGSGEGEGGFPLYLRYKSASGIVFDRIVQAASLEDVNGEIVMRAFCHRSKAMRRIRIDNVVAAFDLKTRDVSVGGKVTEFIVARVPMLSVESNAPAPVPVPASGFSPAAAE